MKHISNHISKGVLTALLAVTLTSCGDFLDIEPRNIVTEDNFWDEKEDVIQYLMGCYTAMQSEAFISRAIVWGEMRSDNLYPTTNIESKSYDIYQILRENLLSTNSYTRWINYYYVINKCNNVIQKAPEVSQIDPAYRSSELQATIAEATAIRSLCYFYLIRAFESVPFYRDAVQQEDEVLYLPASSFDYILNQIIFDLESVRNSALVRYGSSNQGIGMSYNSDCNRITRSAIDAMLADMYLWQGNYDKVIERCEAILAQKKVDYKEYYGSTTGEVTSSTPEELTAPYGLTLPLYANTVANPSKAFNAIFATGNSFESIFELSFNYSTSSTAYVMSTALGRLYGAGITEKTDGLDKNDGAGYVTVNPSLITEISTKAWKYFVNEYDARYFNSFKVTDNNYGEGIIRKGVASMFNVTEFDSKDKAPFDNVSSSSFEIHSIMDRNWIFYRMTDVMLMEAEALLMKVTDETTDENTELLQKAFDLIYLVNRRSVLNSNTQYHLAFKNYKTKGAMQLLLRAERNRELMFEGKRWFDLVRLARRDGTPDVVRSLVGDKMSGSMGAKRFPSMESLFMPYNKDELKVNTYLRQKAVYANDSGDEYEMN